MPNEDEGFEPGENDRDPGNVQIRAGYLMGMAAKLPPGDDRTFLMRASRSLRAYAELLQRDGPGRSLWERIGDD